jgi:hypothetical protein
MGAEDHGACGRRALALAAALAAACFVALTAWRFSRPRNTAAETAHEVDRRSLAAMFILAALAYWPESCRLVIDALSPITKRSWRPHADPANEPGFVRSRRAAVHTMDCW